jgi:hypothetical protein
LRYARERSCTGLGLARTERTRDEQRHARSIESANPDCSLQTSLIDQREEYVLPTDDESRTRCSSFRFESTQSPLSICALSRTGIRGSASAGSGKSQRLRTALLSSASSAGLPFDNSVVAGALVPRMPAARSTAAACSSVGRGDGKKRQLNAPQTWPCRPSPAREVGRRRRASSETGNGWSGDVRYGMRFGTRKSAPSAQTRCMSALQSNAGQHL